MNGQAFKQIFTVLRQEYKKGDDIPTIDYPEIEVTERCAFVLPVFADSASTDDLKNDPVNFYFGYPESVTAVTLKLYKCDELKATLNNNTYGTFHAYGFLEDGGKKYIGFETNWKEILQAFGEGEYLVRAELTSFLGNQTEDSFTYCLRQYTPARADGTIRIDFFHSGIIGDYTDDKQKKSFIDLNWQSSIRLEGFVLNEKAPIEEEEIQYDNGQKQTVKQEQDPVYEVEVYPIPYQIHKYIRTEVITADDIYINDYNARSPLRPFLQKRVNYTGGYEPNQLPLTTKSSIVLKLKQKDNNLKKRFC